MASEDAAKEKAFNIGYRTMVAVMPGRIDEFAKWLMTGTGATAGLMVAGADKLVPVLGARGFRTTIYLLLVSLGLGIASRLLASIVIVANEVLETMEARLSEPDGQPLHISFLAGGDVPEVEEQFRKEFVSPLPPHVRWMTWWLSRRKRRPSSLSLVGRLLVRSSAWQGLFALLSVLTMGTAVLWAASCLTLVP
jgi:hypothetical protein